MFYHGYNSYLEHAFPADELCPLTCKGTLCTIHTDHLNHPMRSGRDTWGGYSLTLIDALDTLAVLGNTTEFARACQTVIATVRFDRDTNVSVFEVWATGPHAAPYLRFPRKITNTVPW